MKEIALIGTNSSVLADVLTGMLENGVKVNAYLDYPEKMMVKNPLLSVGRFDVMNPEEAFKNHSVVVLTFNDDLTDAATNDFALKAYTPMLKAAEAAGVKKVIVVGSPDSSAYFSNDLKRIDKLDGSFISTRGNFAKEVVTAVTAG